ncbi:hypothetical protein ACWC3Y_11055 [Streptomyces sp. NPDC001296]
MDTTDKTGATQGPDATDATEGPSDAPNPNASTESPTTPRTAASGQHSPHGEASATEALTAATTARQKIANLLWWSVPSSTDEEAKARTEQLLDAYRTEVLAKAIGRLRAIPVQCTALTGPVWYGDGWNSAITCLEEIAEYQLPDEETYPGELQRLRALALATRAALRKGELTEVQRVMDAHVTWEKEATA